MSNEIENQNETSSPLTEQQTRPFLWLNFAVLIVIIDQISKWSVLHKVTKPGLSSYLNPNTAYDPSLLESIPFFTWLFQSGERLPFYSTEITSFFNLNMVWNKGVSFGLFNEDTTHGPLILSALTGMITVIFTIWLLRSKSTFQMAALALIIGGAIGNIFDRLRFGAVIDFLDFHIAGYHWPSFNVADATIVIGVGLLIIHNLFFDTE